MSSYCSIEEAWGDNFCKPTKPKKKRVVSRRRRLLSCNLSLGRRRSKPPKRYKHTDSI